MNNATYTYTARNINNPDKVVTFTLNNGHMRVSMPELLEQADAVIQADDRTDEVKSRLSTQAGPAVMELVERVAGPTRISDVNASLDDGKLQITLWQRLAGLRLAPVVFNMGRIDNVEAAGAFVEQLEDRKEHSAYEGRFIGPLDYWIGWAGLFLLIGILFRWPGKHEKNREE